MTAVVYGVLYLCAAVFAIACVARAVMYAKAPIHLRWELYPVPHEEAARVRHGGSYFEQIDWWKHPPSFNLAGELSFMVPEMLFLKALHEFNRKLWYRSFLFHFGLYLLIGTVGLVVVAAVLTLAAPAAMAGGLGLVLHWMYVITGVAGGALAVVGAVALLVRRLTDPDLVNYTTPGDLFNLCFFLVAFAFMAAGYLLRGPDAPGVVHLTAAWLTFDTSPALPGLWSAGIILCALLAAYIPLTHMSHFIAKYFTYHSVRWDDAATANNPKIAAKLAEYLTYRPTWSAPHVTADGKRSWADIATTNPWEGGKK